MTKLIKYLVNMQYEIQYELECLQRDIEIINERMNAYEDWYDNIADRIKRESKE